MKEKIKKIALDEGAAGVGVSSVERFRGGPPSMDASYVLPGAKSVISIMLPLDGDIIRRYLGKEDHAGFQRHETEVYRELYRIAGKIGEFLESEGFKAAAPEPNLDYRFKQDSQYKRIPYKRRQASQDWLRKPSGPGITLAKRLLVTLLYGSTTAGIDWRLTPSFSHRYAAVACGLGSFGWSGNVMNPEFGSRVLFTTVITDAELDSDPMLEESPCDGCRTCVKVCQAGFINMKEKTEVKIGGKTFIHNKKGHNLRCIFVCAGFTGQSKYKGWSTWSPGRITLPETDDQIEKFWERFVKDNAWKHNYYSKVLADLVFHNEYGFIRKPKDRFLSTCGNCQLVCWKTREERKDNYDLLIESGEVVEGPDFSFVVERKS